MNYYLLALGHLAAAAFDVAAVFWWVRYDVRTFNVNPADDSFGAVFHRQRGTWRAGTFAAALLLCALPAAAWHRWHGWLPLPHLGPAYWLNFGSLAALACGIWLRTFNPQLSKRRALAYVERFYISFAANAAYFPDKLLARWATRKFPNAPAQAKEWAASKNHLLLNVILWCSIAASATLLFFTIHN